MRAVQRDALSPRRALFWAERLAAGEAAPEQVDQLTAPPGIPREIAAARNIACQVADILSRVQDLAGQVGPQAGAEPYPPGWETLFPDVAAQVGAVGWPPFEPQNTLIGRGHVSMSRPPIVYDGESQGRRRGSLSVVGIVVFSVSRCATVVRMTEDEAKTVAALAAQCAHGARSNWDLMMRYGRLFRPGTAGGGYPMMPALAGKNAYRRAMDSGLLYAEGYTCRPPGIHKRSAWCLDGETVVDPGFSEPGTAYFGVPLRSGYVRRVHEAWRSDDGHDMFTCS
jgi:hypothetical protein